MDPDVFPLAISEKVKGSETPRHLDGHPKLQQKRHRGLFMTRASIVTQSPKFASTPAGPGPVLKTSRPIWPLASRKSFVVLSRPFTVAGYPA